MYNRQRLFYSFPLYVLCNSLFRNKDVIKVLLALKLMLYPTKSNIIDIEFNDNTHKYVHMETHVRETSMNRKKYFIFYILWRACQQNNVTIFFFFFLLWLFVNNFQKIVDANVEDSYEPWKFWSNIIPCYKITLLCEFTNKWTKKLISIYVNGILNGILLHFICFLQI